MTQRGVIVGKFYPPHRGHSYLIASARAQVDHLTVIVCDTPAQTIPGALRGAWLRELHPDVTVLVIDDLLGDDDTAAWAEHTVRWLGGVPDVVFTSEAYGEPFARALGCRHVLVDRERRAVPIAATAIRADPYAHWEYLAPCVRAYFARRVVIVGAESTGKTTLAQDLARVYRTSWVPEYGRTYSEGKVAAAEGERWETREFVAIARAQNRLEDDLARLANRVLICDTDAFATAIWHERYLGRWSAEVAAESAARRCDLYMLTGVDLPFVQDGLRDGEHVRAWMQARFREELARRGVPFVELPGDRAERVERARALIEPLLREPPRRAREAAAPSIGAG